MKVQADFPLMSLDKEYDFNRVNQFVAAVAQHLNELSRAVNEGLGFGNGTDLENMRGTWKSFTSHAVANTEDTIAHGLTVVPIGYLVFKRDKAGVLYSGSTAWDTTNIYLKSSVAATAYLIFIVTATQASS